MVQQLNVLNVQMKNILWQHENVSSIMSTYLLNLICISLHPNNLRPFYTLTTTFCRDQFTRYVFFTYIISSSTLHRHKYMLLINDPFSDFRRCCTPWQTLFRHLARTRKPKRTTDSCSGSTRPTCPPFWRTAISWPKT